MRRQIRQIIDPHMAKDNTAYMTCHQFSKQLNEMCTSLGASSDFHFFISKLGPIFYLFIYSLLFSFFLFPPLDNNKSLKKSSNVFWIFISTFNFFTAIIFQSVYLYFSLQERVPWFFHMKLLVFQKPNKKCTKRIGFCISTHCVCDLLLGFVCLWD